MQWALKEITTPRSSGISEVPWYATEAAWEAMFQIAGFSADVLRVAQQPVAATTVDTISGLLQRRVLSKKDMTLWLRNKLQVISTQMQSISKTEDHETYTKLDAQLVLILELLNETQGDNG